MNRSTLRIEFAAQLKKMAGSDAIELEAGISMSLQKAIYTAAEKSTEALREMLFQQGGQFSQSIMITVNDDQVEWDENPELQQGDRIGLYSPMSGG